MLETKIDELTKAMNRLAAAIESNGSPTNVVPLESKAETPAPKKKTAAKKAAKKVEEPVAEEPEPTPEPEAETPAAEVDVEVVGVTEDDLKELGMKLLKAKKMKEYSEIIKSFGASKVGELDPAKYDECYAKLQAEVEKL